jgi:hypothetical protein
MEETIGGKSAGLEITGVFPAMEEFINIMER